MCPPWNYAAEMCDLVWQSQHHNTLVLSCLQGRAVRHAPVVSVILEIDETGKRQDRSCSWILRSSFYFWVRLCPITFSRTSGFWNFFKLRFNGVLTECGRIYSRILCHSPAASLPQQLCSILAPVSPRAVQGQWLSPFPTLPPLLPSGLVTSRDTAGDGTVPTGTRVFTQEPH